MLRTFAVSIVPLRDDGIITLQQFVQGYISLNHAIQLSKALSQLEQVSLRFSISAFQF